METLEKKVKHTPGPWVISELNGTIDGEENIVIEHEGFPLCEVRGSNDMSCMEDDEIEPTNKMVIANAKLIAAAPELLEALRILLEACELADAKGDLSEDVDGSLMDLANKAIQKATE